MTGSTPVRPTIFRSGRVGGDVAQLGEHLLCKQGVTGSIPVISTNFGRMTESCESYVNLLGSEGFMELLFC